MEHPPPVDWLDPCNDFVFKQLLTSPKSDRLLRHVIEIVVRPHSPIVSAKVLDPVRRPTFLDEKEIVFDVRVVLADGTEIDIEMQAHPTPALPERLVYYGARGLVGQLGPGDGYVALRPSIVIAFLRFRTGKDGRFHRTFRLLDVQSHREFSSLLEVHTIELPRVRSLDDDETSRHDPLVLFSRFLLARTTSDLANVAEESPAMKEAVELLRDLSSDAEIRRLAADREARIRLDEAYRRAELREACELAAKEGREALARGVAGKLHAAGQSLAFIASTVDFPEATVASWLTEL